ncbi:membralin [Clonorchis sinensis]|uniref:Membralin n=1 Tax=Clonorchis sinensis TaxID=79923 RepID=H2KV94_CLOSI|nr:membralin [Clonorchis sinensis]
MTEATAQDAARGSLQDEGDSSIAVVLGILLSNEPPGHNEEYEGANSGQADHTQQPSTSTTATTTTADASNGSPPRQTRQQIPRTNPVTDMFNARIQLSEAFFRRVAMGYARIFPLTARRIIEFGFLVQAFFVLGVFIHLHLMFVRSPITCLDKLRTNYQPTPILESAINLFDEPEPIARNHYAPGDPSTPREPWPRYGILRVEVIRHPDPRYSLADSYAKEFYGSAFNYGDDVDELFSTEDEQDVDTDTIESIRVAGNAIHTPAPPVGNTRPRLLFHEPGKLWTAILSAPGYISQYLQETIEFIYGFVPLRSNNKLPAQSPKASPESFVKRHFIRILSYLGNTIARLSTSVVQFFRDASHWFHNFHVPAHEDNHIIEYALEYGFLRLSPAMRKRLNITVKLVVLDPDVDACFGGVVSRFLMEEFLGYDDLLLGSIKHLAVSESVKGHMANVVSGQHYRLVSSQMSRSSYLVATLVMLLFTFCVSVLLRYSSHQLVLVIADILQVFETNVAVGIPATPFMTVILALVAIETIMSEFFGDSFTAFYVILIVSICDHYEAIFCRTEISRRYWPRFFYLYHVAFYAYHYRFNGQFSSMALWVSWLFTLHSMIYFFHHYELPNLLSDWELREFFNHVGSGDQIVGHFQIQLRTQPWSGSVEIVRSIVDASSMSAQRIETPSLMGSSPGTSVAAEESEDLHSEESSPSPDHDPLSSPQLSPGGDVATGSDSCITEEKSCNSEPPCSFDNSLNTDSPELVSQE